MAYQAVVRKGGLEPPFPCGSQILSLVRLPIPPLSHAGTAWSETPASF
jgi:hypothetical protein